MTEICEPKRPRVIISPSVETNYFSLCDFPDIQFSIVDPRVLFCKNRFSIPTGTKKGFYGFSNPSSVWPGPKTSRAISVMVLSNVPRVPSGTTITSPPFPRVFVRADFEEGAVDYCSSSIPLISPPFCGRVSDRIQWVKCSNHTPGLRDRHSLCRVSAANRWRRPNRPGNGPCTRPWESTHASSATTRRATRLSTKGAVPSWECPRAFADPATVGENTGTRVTVSTHDKRRRCRKSSISLRHRRKSFVGCRKQFSRSERNARPCFLRLTGTVRFPETSHTISTAAGLHTRLVVVGRTASLPLLLYWRNVVVRHPK